MKAVEIVNKEIEPESNSKQEYDEFCKKRFSLEVSGAELLALIVFAANSFGNGFNDVIYDFYDDNLNYVEDLECGSKLMSSVEEFECKQIKFN